MPSDYFCIYYRLYTVSGVLLQIDRHKSEGEIKVHPLIIANESEDHYSELSDLINAMSAKINANELLIHPAIVADILTEHGVNFAYDELDVDLLITAIKIHINKVGNLDAIYQICQTNINA